MGRAALFRQLYNEKGAAKNFIYTEEEEVTENRNESGSA